MKLERPVQSSSQADLSVPGGEESRNGGRKDAQNDQLLQEGTAACCKQLRYGRARATDLGSSPGPQPGGEAEAHGAQQTHISRPVCEWSDQ